MLIVSLYGSLVPLYFLLAILESVIMRDAHISKQFVAMVLMGIALIFLWDGLCLNLNETVLPLQNGLNRLFTFQSLLLLVFIQLQLICTAVCPGDISG